MLASLVLSLCLGAANDDAPPPPAVAPQAAPTPMKVGIVVFAGVEMLDFAGPVEVFVSAGGRLRVGGQPLIEVVTVAPTRDRVLASGGVELRPAFSIADAPHLDVVVIPGGETSSLGGNADFDAWLRATAESATVVMSVCNGAFVLADHGLLDGCEATTFHAMLGMLRSEAPKTKVLTGRRVVDNGHVVTAGGVSCGIDGALHLVARFGGRRLADEVAEYMEYRWTPEPQLEGAYPEWTTIGGRRAVLEQQFKALRAKSDWPAAEKVARELTGLDPADGAAWYGLGYALLAQGRLDEAIAASEESANHPGPKTRALYNVSCAWAVKGDHEKALDALTRATDAGWNDRRWTEQDQDLASLRGDPRFVALLERIGAQAASRAVAKPAAPVAPAAAPAAAPPARARRLAIVLFDGEVLLEVAGPARILASAPGFTTYTVAAMRAPVRTDDATIVPDYTYDDAPPPDVIVLASGGGLRDAALRTWLRKNGPRADAVMSVCNGALVLASAGLLDGRAVTCPSGNFDGLRLFAKDVRPFRDRRFTRDGNVVTCDSYFAGVDGALDVVRDLCGDAAAQSAATANLYVVPPRAPDPRQEPTPPSHQLAILKTVHEKGVAAGLAAWQEWLAGGPREQPGPVDRARERLHFLILGWTLEGAGRGDEARELCEFTAAAFPESAYALACLGEAEFACGAHEEALATLLEADQKEPGVAKAQETFAAILRSPDFVAGVSKEAARRARQSLRDHAAAASATLTPRNEPGERMVVRGVVRDAAGTPLPNALLSVFHADASGRYTPAEAMDEPNARLFAFLRSDADGRFSFATVRPGAYPQPRRDVAADGGDERWIPQHVHVEVEAAGHAPRRFQMVFRDDPRMTAHWLQWADEQRNPVVELVRDGAGTWRGSCDITLD